MSDANIQELLNSLREVRLEVEALKRMFFEHRPAFVQAFAQQREAVEAAGFLRALDGAITQVQSEMASVLAEKRP